MDANWKVNKCERYNFGFVNDAPYIFDKNRRLDISETIDLLNSLQKHKDLLDEMITYIEESEVSMYSERWEVVDAKQLIERGEMPDIYNKIIYLKQQNER